MGIVKEFTLGVAMNRISLASFPTVLLGVFSVVLLLSCSALAGSGERVLHRFQGGNDGSGSKADLFADPTGNLYGTTFSGGGQASEGTIFQLSPPATKSGAWTETLLHSFETLSDGQYPWAGLVGDKAGNLYGTTWLGGTFGDCGVVFKLAPAGGTWTYSVLHNFDCDGSADGGESRADLIIDQAGNLYGTTTVGGTGRCSGGCGAVFELSPSHGGWTETVLYNFPAVGTGEEASGGTGGSVVLDNKGNLYGTTFVGGGSNSAGTVFELKRPAHHGGAWKYIQLHSFNRPDDGQIPQGGLTFDSQGTLYGTTQYGAGSGCYGNGCGAVFRLAAQKNGKWSYSVLYRFAGTGDGGLPESSLTLGAGGTLYGTTQLGGSGSKCSSLGCGVAFRLKPPQKNGGPWVESVLHSFQGGKDGYVPWGRVVFGKAGRLYGATQFGGIPSCDFHSGCGTVFSVDP
jgi:uncharacterized repeat protein (TIGR03803 family)